MRLSAISIAATFGLAIAGPALAQEAATDPNVAMREGDEALTCRQMADEAAELSASMSTSSSGGVFGALGGVARSGAVMLVPGAGLLMAGADVVTKPGRDRRETAEVTAQQRWYYLNGLYAGRRCNPQAQGETAEASQTAHVSPPVPPTTVAAVAPVAPVTPARTPAISPAALTPQPQ